MKVFENVRRRANTGRDAQRDAQKERPQPARRERSGDDDAARDDDDDEELPTDRDDI